MRGCRRVGRWLLAALVMAVVTPCVWLYACTQEERIRTFTSWVLLAFAVFWWLHGCQMQRHAARLQREILLTRQEISLYQSSVVSLVGEINAMKGHVHALSPSPPPKRPWWRR